jgi:hypothetical protein
MSREQRLPELRRLPVTRTVPLPRSGLDAGVHVLRRFGPGDVRRALEPPPVRRQRGEVMLVLLRDAVPPGRKSR